jgi:hypothetical protein
MFIIIIEVKKASWVKQESLTLCIKHIGHFSVGNPDLAKYVAHQEHSS